MPMHHHPATPLPTDYITEHTPLPGYYPLPKCLLPSSLSSTATLTYAVLLGRSTLSQFHHWVNEAGRVYVIYTIEELARTIGRGHTAVKTALRDLEQAGLIERRQQGCKQPNHIFVRIPAAGFPAPGQAENRPREGRNPARPAGGKAAASNIKEKYNFSHMRQLIPDYSCDEEDTL